MRDNTHRNRVVTSILASMVAIYAMSQARGERPQLVVNILVDQMRGDYIELLHDYFGESGFKRLSEKGVCFENVDFNADNVDMASGTAMLVTGSYPRINGVSGSQFYDINRRFSQKVLTDASTMGNFTNEKLSPKALRVSTLSDELKISTQGRGYVYSIAADAQQSIILAGHAANGAYWIDNVNGKWATTTFYPDMPKFLSNRNYKTPLSARIDTMAWTPSKSMQVYAEILSHAKNSDFRYVFPVSRPDRYKSFKRSALVNEEVTTVALDFLASLDMGKRGEVDMLNLGYTLSPYSDEAGEGSVELVDKYLRLDSQLARLFDAIDSRVGLQNTLVVVSSTGYFSDNSIVEARYKVPTGVFNPNKAKSLLNLYLVALYGNAHWVDDFNGETFYLNHKAAKEHNITVKELRRSASDFLRRMSGVARTYSLDDIIDNAWGNVDQKVYNALVANHAGDVIVKVMPGWVISESDDSFGADAKVIRSNIVSTPVYILHPKLSARKIIIPVDAIILAPTISRLLRIRSPNAAYEKPYILE